MQLFTSIFIFTLVLCVISCFQALLNLVHLADNSNTRSNIFSPFAAKLCSSMSKMKDSGNVQCFVRWLGLYSVCLQDVELTKFPKRKRLSTENCKLVHKCVVLLQLIIFVGKMKNIERFGTKLGTHMCEVYTAQFPMSQLKRVKEAPNCAAQDIWKSRFVLKYLSSTSAETIK